MTWDTRVRVGEWTHVVHTYREGEAKLYVNGVLDGTNIKQDGPLKRWRRMFKATASRATRGSN